MQLEALVDRVEQSLYATGESEVSSEKIGELVINELTELDDVAYIRFASVYRSFNSVGSFESELSRMKQKRRILKNSAKKK